MGGIPRLAVGELFEIKILLPQGVHPAERHAKAYHQHSEPCVDMRHGLSATGYAYEGQTL